MVPQIDSIPSPIGAITPAGDVALEVVDVATVTVMIGERTWIAGSVPDVDLWNPDYASELEHIVDETRAQSVRSSRAIATRRDAVGILTAHEAELRLAIRGTENEGAAIGRMTRVLREARRMPRAELAAALGVTVATIRRWESGRVKQLSWSQWAVSEALGYGFGAMHKVYRALLEAA